MTIFLLLPLSLSLPPSLPAPCLPRCLTSRDQGRWKGGRGEDRFHSGTEVALSEVALAVFFLCFCQIFLFCLSFEGWRTDLGPAALCGLVRVSSGSSVFLGFAFFAYFWGFGLVQNLTQPEDFVPFFFFFPFFFSFPHPYKHTQRAITATFVVDACSWKDERLLHSLIYSVSLVRILNI